jgi:hypothetical protein
MVARVHVGHCFILDIEVCPESDIDIVWRYTCVCDVT